MPYVSDLIPLDEARSASDFEGRAWYTIDPDVVYPWTLARIAEALQGGETSPTIRGSLLPRAARLPAEAWALAATDRDLLGDATPAQLAQRAEALDIIRLWATELHHAAIGYAPRGLHILRRPAWRD